MIRRPLIVGGSNGIGLGIATALADRDEVEVVYIVDKDEVDPQYMHYKFRLFQYDLLDDYEFPWDRFDDIDSLIITAGFGRLELFKDIDEETIESYFKVNTIPTIKLVHQFYDLLSGSDDFYCCVLVSIAGFLSSPWLSVYGSTKAALRSFIESVNVELKKSGSPNRILNVSPGYIDGTSFYGGETDLTAIASLSQEIIKRLERREDLYIPDFDEVYCNVLKRYQEDFRAEGDRSYEYKKNKIR